MQSTCHVVKKDRVVVVAFLGVRVSLLAAEAPAPTTNYALAYMMAHLACILS